MIRNEILKHLPGAIKGQRGGSKGNVSGGATARGAMEKSRYVRINDGKEVKKNDPIEYFLPRGV